jgi:hypothetical protein
MAASSRDCATLTCRAGVVFLEIGCAEVRCGGTTADRGMRGQLSDRSAAAGAHRWISCLYGVRASGAAAATACEKRGDAIGEGESYEEKGSSFGGPSLQDTSWVEAQPKETAVGSMGVRELRTLPHELFNSRIPYTSFVCSSSGPPHIPCSTLS